MKLKSDKTSINVETLYKKFKNYMKDNKSNNIGNWSSVLALVVFGILVKDTSIVLSILLLTFSAIMAKDVIFHKAVINEYVDAFIYMSILLGGISIGATVNMFDKHIEDNELLIERYELNKCQEKLIVHIADPIEDILIIELDKKAFYALEKSELDKMTGVIKKFASYDNFDQYTMNHMKEQVEYDIHYIVQLTVNNEVIEIPYESGDDKRWFQIM